MSLLTQLVPGYTGKLVRQAVATFAAIALVGVSVGAACQCLMQANANRGNHDSECCCPTDSSSTVTVQASTCDNTCMIAQAKALVGETLAVPDSAPPSVLLVSVAAGHHAFASTPAPALIVEAPPLSLSSPHPILRI